VLTNSLTVAEALGAAEGMRVILCPGDLYPAERAAYGAETHGFLERFNADMALIGASGLTVAGPSDVESRASWVKRAMLGQAVRRVLLVDSGKFGKAHLERICGLSTLTDLVTDQPPPPDLAAALGRAEVRITIAPPEE
jgi:DeoR/GlpR family transcriptional regulator of sugar metabolism